MELPALTVYGCSFATLTLRGVVGAVPLTRYYSSLHTYRSHSSSPLSLLCFGNNRSLQCGTNSLLKTNSRHIKVTLSIILSPPRVCTETRSPRNLKLQLICRSRTLSRARRDYWRGMKTTNRRRASAILLLAESNAEGL